MCELVGLLQGKVFYPNVISVQAVVTPAVRVETTVEVRTWASQVHLILIYFCSYFLSAGPRHVEKLQQTPMLIFAVDRLHNINMWNLWYVRKFIRKYLIDRGCICFEYLCYLLKVKHDDSLHSTLGTKSRPSVTVIVTCVWVKNSKSIQSGWIDGLVNLKDTKTNKSIGQLLMISVKSDQLYSHTWKDETQRKAVAHCGSRCSCNVVREMLKVPSSLHCTGNCPSTEITAPLTEKKQLFFNFKGFIWHTNVHIFFILFMIYDILFVCIF